MRAAKQRKIDRKNRHEQCKLIKKKLRQLKKAKKAEAEGSNAKDTQTM